MTIPLNERQQVAYNSEARIVVIPACPGSGKTRLFVAAVLREFELERKGYQGVAAISFTNAAEQEISSRIPCGVAYPNFVGTIDSFLLKYVVRPFGSSLVNLKRFRYPSASNDYPIQNDEVQIPSEVRGIRLAEVDLVRTDAGTKFLFKKIEITDQATARTISDAKKSAWQRGEVLHNDVCFIASRLLEDDGIRGRLLERFPSILVDEFQDIAGSRESAILKLLRDERLNKGFVVGDPNQCIMQFTGARADLFAEVSGIPGANTSPLTATHRFNSAIGAVASNLSITKDQLEYPEESIHSHHSTVLLSHDKPVREAVYADEILAFERFLSVNNTPLTDHLLPAVLVRKTKLANQLRGEFTSAIDFRSRFLETLYLVVSDFHSGKMSEALEATERILSILAEFEGTQPTEDELLNHRMTPLEWKRVVWNLALSISQFAEGETLDQWIVATRQTLQEFINRIGSQVNLSKKYRVMRAAIGEAKLNGAMHDLVSRRLTDRAMHFSNVHQSKGREYPATCIIFPRQAANEEGIAETWFDNQDSEEARIAYVALTRAKHGLMVILPQTTIEALERIEKGKHFLQSFEYRESVANYLAQNPA